MLPRLLQVFLVLLIAYRPAFAQTTDHSGKAQVEERVSSDSVQISASRESVPSWHAMITNVPGDWLRFGRATFTAENIPAIVGITAATGMLIAADDATWKSSDRLYNSSSFAREGSDFCEWIGDGRTQFGIAGSFAIYGFAAGDGRALRTGSQVTEAILACGTVVQILKHISGRESPLVSTRPGGRWRFLPNQIEYHKHVPHYDAYPSGHIATALATVIVIAENYEEASWIRPAGFTLVGLLGIAMANRGIHWYSDYPMGLALGYSFGMIAAHPGRLGVTSAATDKPGTLSLGLKSDGSGSGIQFTMHL